jgi:hypothetical protein
MAAIRPIEGRRCMLFGHNSNVKVGETTFHVQTEDRGVASALIDTTVYHAGRVMHRRTNNYHDLIPLNPDRQEALRLRLNEQHRATIEEIRSGALYLAAQPAVPSKPEAHAPAASLAPTPNNATVHNSASPLKLELRNARTWLTGKQAKLELSVQDHSGQPQQGAKVTAHIEGAATPEEFSSETNAEGQTEISFAMPRLSTGDAALVIEAWEQARGGVMNRATNHGKLRFSLRSKPKLL